MKYRPPLAAVAASTAAEPGDGGGSGRVVQQPRLTLARPRHLQKPQPQGAGNAGSSVCLPSITSSVGIGGDKRRKNTTNQSSTRDTRFTWKTLLMRVGKTTSAN